MYKASMYNVVSGHRTFKFDGIDEYISCATVACMKGQNEILKWVIRIMIEDYPEKSFKFLWIELLEYVVDNGSLVCVKTLFELDDGFPSQFHWIQTILPVVCSINRASSHGRLEILNWVFENGGSFADLPCLYRAANNGNFECMKFVYEKGCRNWTHFTNIATNAVVCEGHLYCLIYAHENGCPLSEDTIYYAAIYRRLDCYMYLRQNGLRGTPTVMYRALITNGWPEPRA